ncbi:MAG: M1 family aminopeptidase, partial [Actinomycetia bacterium]|nr:M1 family aminopeptidase [Actinomycetes bacterium]
MTLTADEAAARAALLSVARYDVRFDLREFAARGTFRTHARVEFGCAAPGAASWIDLLARAVRRARLNGADLDLARCWDGERIALAGLAERNVLVVESEHDAGAGRGLSRSVDPADGAVYAWTQFQPYDARRAFACFDQPSLKAPVAIAAIVPDGWTCVSNGVARMGDADGDDADGGDAEGGARTWTFSTTPPLPTYAMAFAAGPFHVVAGHVMEGTAVTGTAVTGAVVGQPGPAGPVGPPGPAGPVGAVAVRLHARRSLAARLDRDAPELLALTAAGLEFFGREFDLPYPASSYDYVFLPDQPGAMENFGCVTWGDAVLRPEAPTDSQRQRRASVLLHEMAHMWFGDLVTPAWWDGLWLNESFASWAGGWAEAALRGDDVGWQRFLLTREIPAQLADDGPTSHPIDRPVPDVDAAEANFDLITYVKGTAVLRQLVAWVGEEAFLTGIRRYFRRFAWRNATMADLLDELSAASGRELRSWAGDWLGRAGVNTVSVAASVSGAGGRDLAAGERYESVELVQDGGGGPRPHRLRLGVYDADPD